MSEEDSLPKWLRDHNKPTEDPPEVAAFKRHAKAANKLLNDAITQQENGRESEAIDMYTLGLQHQVGCTPPYPFTFSRFPLPAIDFAMDTMRDIR